MSAAPRRIFRMPQMEYFQDAHCSVCLAAIPCVRVSKSRILRTPFLMCQQCLWMAKYTFRYRIQVEPHDP